MSNSVVKVMKRILFIPALLIAGFLIYYFGFAIKPHELMEFDDPWGQTRPMAVAKQHGVVAGTPWASQAAMDVLDNGGNAYDAAVAGLLMLYMTHGTASAFPGIAPAMVYEGSSQEIRGYVGVGTAPELATIEKFKDRGFDTVPKNDIYAQLLPGGPDTLITLLDEHGTMSFAELAQPAIDLALEGFPTHEVTHFNLQMPLYKRIGFAYLMPYNAEVYLGGNPLKPVYRKERFRRPDLAKLFRLFAENEKNALQTGKSRSEALQAVRSTFYNGQISNVISEFHLKEEGLIRESDLKNYRGYWETPPVGQYGEYEIHVNGPWSQGMALPMALSILEGVDLRAMERNSAAYIHTLTQAIELAMADREAYFGDPDFVDVPIKQLLDRSYGVRRRLMLTDTPFNELSAPIRLEGYEPFVGSYPQKGTRKTKTVGDDTSQIIVVDKDDNLVAITPSDFPMTPMVPGWDITLGNRMTQFRLVEGHPAALAPGKRPRASPQAVMIKKNGEFYMAINTPGGDNQVQAMLQVLLNHFVFGDDIQTAIEQPRFMTLGFPSSFSPHIMKLETLEVEEPMGEEVMKALESKGYKVKSKPPWRISAGVGAIVKAEEGYVIGSDPRDEGIALGR